DSRNDSRMNVNTFYSFLGSIADWAKLEDNELINDNNTVLRDSQGHRLVGYKIINKLFDYFDRSSTGGITLQDAVLGLGAIKFGDILSRIELFFNLHDSDKDGYLSKEEILQIIYSSSDSNNSEAPSIEDDDDTILSLPLFREVILSDEYLVDFFDTGFAATFQLVEPVEERQKGLGREIFNSLMSDGMKFASLFGKRQSDRRKSNVYQSSSPKGSSLDVRQTSYSRRNSDLWSRRRSNSHENSGMVVSARSTSGVHRSLSPGSFLSTEDEDDRFSIQETERLLDEFQDES
ncbi:6499_t:CDS:2, partial [Racocetra fulgida]